ncbi:amidohydrolase [Chitinophaga ginsengisoli]|nr:amidohydrolase [Chitinophaga ginsengisoli]
MEHRHHHSCTHCACNNPILTLLKDELFSPENFAALPTTKIAAKKEQAQAFMVTGGTIRPMINGSVETVPAIGFADGYVVATGTEEQVYAFMQENHPGFLSRELQEGNTLLPGLIEPHVHLVPTAMLMGWTDLGGFDNQDLRQDYDIASVSSIIKKAVANLKPDQWFLGAGLDPALMPLQKDNTELITIDIDLLDSITVAAPVLIISASMHTLYLNTPALQLVWNFPGNLELLNTYSSFNDYRSKTKGQLQQAAEMNPALKTIPPPQKAAMFLEAFVNLKTIFDTANARGVTFMYDAGMNNTLKAMLEAYLAVNTGTVRIGAAQVCDTIDDAKKLPKFQIKPGYEDIYLSHVKVITDGSNQGLTAYQSEPYLCKPDNNYGIYNYGGKYDQMPQHPPLDFKALMEIIIREKGWPVMIHANGNLAVQFAIQALKDSIPAPAEGIRHRIEHCSLTTQDDLNTMKQLEVSPSFLIGHVGYWGYAFQEAIFGEKSSMLDLCNSALQKGMRITLHSDNQVSPLGPLRMMEQSITRRMEADPERGILNVAECITAEQGLTAITYDAAWQCYAEQWTGSLKVGNFADFVVLEQDPLTMKRPYMNMRNIGVLETWVAGSLVYGSTVSEEVSIV